jgi:hypothetical protein
MALLHRHMALRLEASGRRLEEQFLAARARLAVLRRGIAGRVGAGPSCGNLSPTITTTTGPAYSCAQRTCTLTPPSSGP